MEKQDSKKDKSGQAPSRKGKQATALRNIHGEQIVKLQMKHQQDVDFLEDIRNFTKMRAAVEKEYAQALLKLATTYLQRKLPTVPEMKTDADDHRTVYSVWRTLLDETEKIAKARLAATEVYQQQVSEHAKGLRLYKMQVAKKCFDNLRRMHEEIQQCVVEIDKSKKLYFEEEHMAHEARQKADEADEKLRRKKGRIFQSISSLQKNSAKFSFRKEACDIQATKARNDYVLALVAANAHQTKFYDTDLPDLIQLLDCDIYDKVKEYILLVSRTELLTCAACQSSFSVVQEQANMATKQYAMECYFHDNPVLSLPLLYEFEPCDNDKINKLSTEHNAGLCLSKEARRWATCVAKETRVIRDCNQELKKLLAQLNAEDRPPGPINEQSPQAEMEARIDELRNIIRRAQTSKKKAEARLEAMKECGVNVDEWIRTSDSESITASDASGDSLSRSGTLTSKSSQKKKKPEVEPESEQSDAFYDSDTATEPPLSAPVEGGAEPPSFQNDLASAVDVVAAVQSAWDAAAEPEEYAEPEPTPPPPPAEPEEVEIQQPQELEPQQPEEIEPKVNGEVTPVLYTRCIAQFSYQASNADELSFVEQEELELIGEGDGDGWVKARNYRGEEGYIPQNYVEVVENQQVDTAPRPQLTSFSSVDYSMPSEGEEVPQQNDEVLPAEPAEVDEYAVEKPDQLPLSLPVNQTIVPSDGFRYCRALYDYEATCDEELTFYETQLIKILRKNVSDVDDGWWEGEVDGKVGLFPSLVVEELKENGEPVTPVDIISPSESGPPPAFTPPKPQLLVLPAQVILTQPTPEVENPPGHPIQTTIPIAETDFQVDATEKKQAQYQQLSASDSESSEHEVQPAEDVSKYAPLESSPDSPTKTMAASLKENALEKIAEEKSESVSAQTDSECPTVVITEAEPIPESPDSQDEFTCKEKDSAAATDAKEAGDAKDVGESKDAGDAKDGKDSQAKDASLDNLDAFECTFPEVSDAEVSAETAETAIKDSKTKSDVDTDVKMEVNSDVASSAKVECGFFDNDPFGTTG